MFEEPRNSPPPWRVDRYVADNLVRGMNMRWPWQRASKIKLDQPAEAFWIAAGPNRRSFNSVTDAVRFVLDDLVEYHRASAWIKIENSSLALEKIEQLYKEHRSAFAVAAGRQPGRGTTSEDADEG